MTYTAQIRIKRDGVQVYQESQAFARKQAAQAWVRKREAELDQPGTIERVNRVGATVKEMIERYVLEMEKARALGKTKLATLKAISESYLGQINDQDLNCQILVEYAVWRMGSKAAVCCRRQPVMIWRTWVPFYPSLAQHGAIRWMLTRWVMPASC